MTVLSALLATVPVGLISISSLAFAEPVPAFPGAEGFGAKSIGGRGGTVIEVTNLNDSGPGSLRAAVEASGPRIVVFSVSGMVILKRRLQILNPYITIAGQTAPGSGITLRNDPSNTKTPLDIRTHDVIIRYLRIRPGPGSPTSHDSVLIYTSLAYNIMIDHVSASWSTDENLSAAGTARDVTIQWSIISEGLMPHSMGSLVSSGARNISLHHNIYTHNDQRSPKLDGDPDKLGGHNAIYDFANNVIYNWGAYATAVAGNAKANVVRNYYKLGPDSSGYTSKGRGEVILWQRDPGRSLFIEGNVGPTCPDGCADDWAMVTADLSSGPADRGERASVRHPAPPVTTTSAQEAFDQVLARAGATYPMRDAVDERVVNDIIQGTGRIITDPSQVGGWPVLPSRTPLQDSDKDGMPDNWEIQNGFNPNDPSDGPRDRDGNGYTNVEEYLNSLVPDDTR